MQSDRITQCVEVAAKVVGIKFHTALAISRASKIAFRAIAQT